MTDKERVLIHIIKTYYPKYLLKTNGIDALSNANRIQIGDLVLCMTSGLHEYTVGYVVSITSNDAMRIREIGSKKTCDISNEMFYKIDKSELNPNYLLEGLEYKTFKKVIQAFKEVDSYVYRFHSISFDGNVCNVTIRLVFTDERQTCFAFKHSEDTTIKEIAGLIAKQISKQTK